MENASTDQGNYALHEEDHAALSRPGSPGSGKAGRTTRMLKYANWLTSWMPEKTVQDLERPSQPNFAQQGQHITLDLLPAKIRLAADKHGTGTRLVDASVQRISILDSNRRTVRAHGTAGSASLRGSSQEAVAGFSGEVAGFQDLDTFSDEQVQQRLCLPAGGGDIVLNADVKSRLVCMERLALKGATALLQKEARSLDTTYGNRIVVEVEVGVHRSREHDVRDATIKAKAKSLLPVKRAGKASFFNRRATYNFEGSKVLDITDMPLHAFLLDRFGKRFRNAAAALKAADRIRYGDVVRLKAIDPLKADHARCLAMHAHITYWQRAPAPNGGLASRADEWVVRPAGRRSDTREALPANAACVLESVVRTHSCVGFHHSRWQVQSVGDGARAWVALAPVEGDDCNGLIYNGQKVWLRRHDQRDAERYCAALDDEDALFGSAFVMYLHGLYNYGSTQGVIARKARCSHESKAWQAQWVLERVRM